MKTLISLFILLAALSLSGASKLPFLYNCWQFESNLFGVSAQPFEIAAPSFTNGLFGLALNCDGALDSAGPAIGTGTFAVHQDFTAMLWFNSRADSNNLILLDCRGTSPNRGFTIYHVGDTNGGGTIWFRFFNGAVVSGTFSTNSAPTNQWNCLLFGYNATTQLPFVRLNDAQTDGVAFVPSAVSLPNMAVGANALHTNPLQCFNGAIDLLSLWKGKVLSATEMGELYNDGLGQNYPFP